jgi:hypothetical protein
LSSGEDSAPSPTTRQEARFNKQKSRKAAKQEIRSSEAQLQKALEEVRRLQSQLQGVRGGKAAIKRARQHSGRAADSDGAQRDTGGGSDESSSGSDSDSSSSSSGGAARTAAKGGVPTGKASVALPRRAPAAPAAGVASSMGAAGASAAGKAAASRVRNAFPLPIPVAAGRPLTEEEYEEIRQLWLRAKGLDWTDDETEEVVRIWEVYSVANEMPAAQRAAAANAAYRDILLKVRESDGNLGLAIFHTIFDDDEDAAKEAGVPYVTRVYGTDGGKQLEGPWRWSAEQINGRIKRLKRMHQVRGLASLPAPHLR